MSATPAAQARGGGDELDVRARALVEALPYIQRFHGRTIVIKLGGAAIESGDARAVLQDVVLLRFIGIRPVLVHGGGPEITAWQKRLGIETRFADGLRVTDEATMEIAQMVLTGKVGPALVSAIHELGGEATGVSGEDGPTLLARRRSAHLGYVGDVAAVDGSLIEGILDRGRIPVVASIGLGIDDHHAYNINADTAAAELAVELGAAKLILLTDVGGILDSGGVLIPELDAAGASDLIASGAVSGGMIPKLNAALRALHACEAVHVIDGRVPHALLLELLTETGIGTMIRRGMQQ